ncbi:MAG: L,D-transpeptidase family protein [Steroidobacteraceae bacterium]
MASVAVHTTMIPRCSLALHLLSGMLLAVPGLRADAASFPLPAAGSDVIGEMRVATTDQHDTLLDVARANGLGYEEITNANPGVDAWLPGAGTSILLPTRRLLPQAPRAGIVINLPEHRLYWFPPAAAGEQRVVWTFPVSIGKMDWHTPLGSTRVVSKVRNPTWTPPASVREEHARRGDLLPAVVPAGPDNPLGQFALRLGVPGGAYLIHGTNRPAGVGMQVTHGCMRLYPEDIERLFEMVPVNTPVLIVNQPYKWGWHDGELLIEIHPPLQEDTIEPPSLTDLTRLIVEATRSQPLAIDWASAEKTWRASRGVPAAVSVRGAGTAAGLSATAN